MGLTELAAAKGETKTTPEYFFDGTEDYANATAITWAHAVNSKKMLEAALNGDKNMLEADVLIGVKEGGTIREPIMAHPPSNTSDITFAEFLSEVMKGSSDRKKGIKLDFKDIESVEPCLKLLKKHSKHIHFPVWLNADILVGPGNPTAEPVDASKFLNLTQKYAPFATLSLGWTTSYDCENPGSYEERHVEAMKSLLDFKLETPPTFPVRAGIAIHSFDRLLELVGNFKSSTVTIWSAKEDALNHTLLHEFVFMMGANRAYLDLPFNLQTGPHATCGTSTHQDDPVDDVANREVVDTPTNGTDGPEPDFSGANLMGSSVIVVAVLAVCLIWHKLY